MVSFEDTLTLGLYFTGMLGIVFLAYYSRNYQDESNARSSTPTTHPTPVSTPPLPPSPTSAEVENEEQEQEQLVTPSTPEEQLSDLIELPTETSANNNPAVVYRGIISQLSSEPDGSEEHPYPTGYSVKQDDGTTLHYETVEETKKEQ